MKTIRELVEEYGVVLKPEGSLLRGLCPLHNDTSKPNFTIYVETSSFYCYACGVGGDVITFLSKIENISLTEARQKLLDESNSLTELQEQIDGLVVDDDPLTFNTEIDVLVSQHCRKYLYLYPNKTNEVMTYLKQFDNKLLLNIQYDDMSKILTEVKQKFVILE